MKKILLIENNPANRKLIRGVLHTQEYQLEETASAREGIEMVLNKNFDLVLLDIQLPGMDGLAATRTLREFRTTKELPIIAVTAHGNKQRILDAGCNAYVAKPIAYRFLLATMDRILQEKEGKSQTDLRR